MRKRIIAPSPQETAPAGEDWLCLADIAEVEITSEDAAHPIEDALFAAKVTGWRAAQPGRQTIRLVFAQPQAIWRIRLHFVEPHVERTQEYALRWSADGGRSYREIVRQQWNFSPRGSTVETEDHRVELPAVTNLELNITPDISGGGSFASLAQLRLA